MLCWQGLLLASQNMKVWECWPLVSWGRKLEWGGK